MMNEITPLLSAKLAQDVYGLTKFDSIGEAIKDLNVKFSGIFDFSENVIIKGKTGGVGPIKCRTAFGFFC
ncbi:MAG: hypothetical protein ACI4NJ_00470 [Cellvibrio sp.]